MNNEQTIEAILWDSINPHCKGIHKHLTEQGVQNYRKAASAVISHVLQGSKWVLLEIGEEIRPGDEFFDYNRPLGFRWVKCSLGVVGDKIDEDHFIHRRPICPPSSVQPAGTPIGGLAEMYASTTFPVSSGDAGAGDPSQDYHVDHYNCIHCGRENSVKVAEPEGETPWVLPPPPTGQQWHREDWTEEMLPEGWRPLLLGEPQEHGDEWLDGSEWSLIYLTMGEVGQSSVKSHYQRRTRRPLPQSAELVVEEKTSPTEDTIKQLVAMVETAKGQLGTLTSERDQLRKQVSSLEERLAKRLAECDEANNIVGQLRKELESAKQSLHETNESYEKAAHDRDAAVRDCRRVTTENVALTKTYKDCETLWQKALQDMRDGTTVRELEASFIQAEQDNAELEQELTRLRSQFRWIPIGERLPTEKDADRRGSVAVINKNGVISSVPWNASLQTHEHWGHSHWMAILLPAPSPETDEQAMRREFEAWYRNHINDNLPKVFTFGHQELAWLAWQAAKSTKEQA